MAHMFGHISMPDLGQQHTLSHAHAPFGAPTLVTYFSSILQTICCDFLFSSFSSPTPTPMLLLFFPIQKETLFRIHFVDALVVASVVVVAAVVVLQVAKQIKMTSLN